MRGIIYQKAQWFSRIPSAHQCPSWISDSLIFSRSLISAMLHDEDVFPRPEEFNPDRFIKNGTLVKDLALDPFVVATFGFGRRYFVSFCVLFHYLTDSRACPGGHIALSTLYIAAASILSAFDILPEVDENNHPIEAKHEFFATAIVSSVFIKFS